MSPIYKIAELKTVVYCYHLVKVTYQAMSNVIPHLLQYLDKSAYIIFIGGYVPKLLRQAF